ncbi:MAG: GNAT family N-acetyltransferase [Pseudomonadota bacterium]
MFEYKTLEGVGIEVIHKAFIEAFSDYQVRIDMPIWKLQQTLKRRGFMPDKSMGAFRDGELAGFILNGCRSWNNKPTVYDAGTGVIPEYRKQGLTTNLFGKVLELLRNDGVEQYLLEVIQQNIAAYELYSKKGFNITRELNCYKLDKSSFQGKNTTRIEHVDGFDSREWDYLKGFWDFKPSWQNSIDSVCATPENFIYSVARQDNEIIGYGIIDKMTGDIPQLAVDRNYRNNGIAASLLLDLLENTESDRISVLNVEDTSENSNAFLSQTGFEHYVDQYEMVMEL